MKNSQKDPSDFAEGSFFTKLTKISKENQVRNVLSFRWYVTYAEFKTL